MSPAMTRSSPGTVSAARLSQATTGLVGHHRLEPGQLAGLGAPARDLVQEVDHLRRHRDARQLEAPVEDRQVRVEPLRREQRAARRTADAHDALAADALRLRFLDQRAQVAAVLGVGAAGEQGEHVVAERPAAARAREHLGDQSAARMTDEMDARSRRQRAHQRQRVGDRAHAEGRVVEAVDALAVAREELAHGRVVQVQSLEKVPTVSENVPCTRTSSGPPSAAAGTAASLRPLPFSGSSMSADRR